MLGEMKNLSSKDDNSEMVDAPKGLCARFGNIDYWYHKVLALAKYIEANESNVNFEEAFGKAIYRILFEISLPLATKFSESLKWADTKRGVMFNKFIDLAEQYNKSYKE